MLVWCAYEHCTILLCDCSLTGFLCGCLLWAALLFLSFASPALVRIYFTQKPLREAHFHLLEVCKDRSASLRIQAHWATRGWTEVVAQILSVPCNEECLRYLNFDPDHGGASAEDASTFLRLCIRTASARAWSMSIWSELPPFKWA